MSNKVTFLGKHGTDYDLQEALKVLKVGQSYEVVGGSVGGWSSNYKLKGFPNKVFNTVMFDKDWRFFSHIMKHDYRNV